MQGKSAIRFVTLVTVCLLVIPLLALVQQPEAGENSPTEGNGEELVRSLCVSCHSVERAVPGGRSREEWGSTVQAMASRGVQILRS